MNGRIKKLSSGLIAFLFSSLAGLSAHADDTEIFFLGTADTDIQPNVLFILDNSISMAADDNTGTSRMDRMKSAMIQLLNNMNNVNVGLMQFSFPGAAVVYPVTDIDQSLTQPAPQLLNISSSEDDAEQATGLGTLTTNNVRLALTNRSSSGNNTITTTVTSSADDTEEFVNNGVINLITSGSLELPIDNLGTHPAFEHVVGTIFRNQSIPKNAVIISAELEFTIQQDSGGNATQNQMFQDPLNLEVTGEVYDTLGTPTINSFTTENIESRLRTTNSVTWNITDSSPAVGETETTPNLAAVIQEIVNQPDWSTGNDIALFIQRPSGDTSTGARVYASFDNSAATSPKLTIQYENPTTTQTQVVGLRYNAVGVPQGATITGATLEFTSASDHDNGVIYNIYGDAAADSSAFTVSNDLISRSSTTNTVTWTPSPWERDQTYTSPDLASIIQEIVNNAAWCGGNSLSLMLANGGDTRFVSAYDDAPGKAPILRLTYDPSSIPPTGGCVASSSSYRVSSGNDDGYGSASSGRNNLTSDDIILGTDGGDNKIAAFRFTNMQLPQNVTIKNAYLEFTAAANDSSSSNLTLYAVDESNADSFCSRNRNYCHFRRKSYLSTTVAWNSVPNWTNGVTYQSPDISALVQALVNKGGWSEGNAMAFAVQGSGQREVVSYNDDPLSAARLVVSYETSTQATGGTARDAMISIVNDMQPKSYTPIVDALYEAALYFRGDAIQWGDERAHNYSFPRNFGNDNVRYLRVSHEDSYAGGSVYWPAGCDENNLNSSNCVNQEVTGNPVYNSPITSECQTNHIVLLTDGEPSQNESVSLIESMIGATSCPEDPITGDSDDECGYELAGFLRNNDQSNQFSDSFVSTHTIAFNEDDSSGFLGQIAVAGGQNGVRSASTSNELVTIFEDIVAEIVTNTNTTFVSPGVTVNSFSRLNHRNEVYYSLFSPQSTPSWPGNLKKYKIVIPPDPNDPTKTLDAVIMDANDSPAVDTSTEFFKDSARSFWSSTADGAIAESGGAAENLPSSASRNVFTYYDGSASKNLSSPVNALTIANKSNITKAMMGIASQTNTYHENLITWARGVDPSTGLARKRLSDPLHSVPQLVTYGGTNANPDITIFYGDNEGFLHAIDADTGVEQFAFIPEELLPNLDIVYENSQTNLHPYGIDGSVTSWHYDVDGDLQIEPADGDHVYIYFGMRRGGRSYYALDVTDRSNPKFMWRIEGGSGDFTELGQSWSKPIKTKVKINNTVTDVLIFSAGYDADQDDTTIITADDVGRAIYIVDATTGDYIWSAGPTSSHTLTNTDMQYSFPATPRVIDTNLDGLADQIYIGDVGGQVWRFDIEHGNSTASLVTGGVIADISDNTTQGARRFFHEPDVSIIVEGNSRKLAIAIGSGFRAHPLDDNVDDRIYMIKQEGLYSAPADGPDSGTAPDYVKLTESDLYDATDNDVQSGSDTTRAVAEAALKSASGWLVQLEGNGEKMLSTGLTTDGDLIFTTYSPEFNSTTCAPSNGTSRKYTMSIKTAAASGPNVIDNGTGVVKTERYETLETSGIAPDSIKLNLDGQPVILTGLNQDTRPPSDTLFKTYWYTK